MSQAAFLSFGCHNITGGSSLRKSIRLIHCAMDCGITKFDVAPSYGLGTAENVLGRALQNRSSGVQITTKFGLEPRRFGTILALGREPYRWLARVNRPIMQRIAPSQIRGANRQQQGPSGESWMGDEPAKILPTWSRSRYLGPKKSLERSLRALRIDRVDTLLTHEALDASRLSEHKADLELARRGGLMVWFGLSGQAEAVEKNFSCFDGLIQVAQVSVEDVHRFVGLATLRCFGSVRFLRHKIAEWSQTNELYQEELFDALSDVELLPDRFALAAMAVSRALFPQTTLIVTSSSELHIANVVRYLGDPNLMSWATAHRAVHERLVSGVHPG